MSTDAYKRNSAYVFLNVDLGSEKKIADQLKEYGEVKEVEQCYGAYDIIVKVVADNQEKLTEVVSWKIRKMDHVRSSVTLTLI